MAEFEAREMEEEQQKPTRDYSDPSPQPLLDMSEFGKWSFYRAVIAEFVATLLFLYITIATLVGNKQSSEGTCNGVGQLGIAWSFGGIATVLIYCITGLSGGHINPAVTFGMMLARKLPVTRGAVYIVAQCAGAVCGAALARGEETGLLYGANGGGVNMVSSGYSKTKGLLAEVLGTFVLVYTVFSAADPRRHARDSRVPILAPLPIGFAVFVVHLATMHITGTGINPARSFGAALVYNHRQAWHDHWIFWVGPMVGSAMATLYYQHILRASRFETGVASRSIPIM